MMMNPKRVTIYFDEAVHKALGRRVADTRQSVSSFVNAAVRSALREDVADLAAFRDRARERTIPLEVLLSDMKRHVRRR